MASALVTGANRGIGLELCRQLKESGRQVIGVCRSASPELAALGVRVVEGIDVTSDDDVQRLAGGVGELDLVICNAGILRRETLEDLDMDSIRQQLEVNALGPLRVVAMLRDQVVQGGKVAIVTSRMGSIEDNTSGSRYGYRMSKAAVNMAGRSLSHDLRGDGIAVALLHPGFVKTEMTGGSGHVTPDEAARGLLARIDELSMDNSGSFWHANGERLPW